MFPPPAPARLEQETGPEPLDSGPPSVGVYAARSRCLRRVPFVSVGDRYGQKGLSGHKENGGWHAAIAGLFTTMRRTAL